MVTRGLSERRALAVVRMSAAALRYVPWPDALEHGEGVALLRRRQGLALEQIPAGKVGDGERVATTGVVDERKTLECAQ